ncbi:MAG: peroxiredoxin family protein [Thaumarchaeota archaeon]|nr:peroxiredoxin family protein [Nitrososphaerota archaeon]
MVLDMQSTKEHGAPQAKKNKLVIVVSKGTVDGLYPPLILATTGAAQGMQVHLYFTFGGMKLLAKQTADNLVTSADLGLKTEELQALLKKGGMPTVKDMLKRARDMGVKIHACSPTMGVFGTTKDQLLEEVDDIIGASTYLDYASDPDAITLFV